MPTTTTNMNPSTTHDPSDSEEGRVQCERCSAQVPEGETHTTRDGEVCGSCYDDYRMCVRCEESVNVDDTITTSDTEDYYCQSCAEELTRCRSCGNYFSDTCEENGVTSSLGFTCHGCNNTIAINPFRHARVPTQSENENAESESRNGVLNTSCTKYQSEEAGEIIKSPRGFGVEIEVALKTRTSGNKIIELVPQGTGVAGDGSIEGIGIEIQTPILKGKAGEEYMRGVCKMLRDNDASVNASCGLHVHISADDIADGNPNWLNNLMRLCVVFEDVVHSFIPYTRRGSSYCRPIRYRINLDVLKGSKARLEQVWYQTTNPDEIADRKRGKGDDSRYCGYNFHMLFAQKHHEVRYHSGTLNAKKILEWANLHLLMADASKRLHEIPDEAYYLTDQEARTNLLFDLIHLPEPSREYFVKRQKVFKVITSSESRLACAE